MKRTKLMGMEWTDTGLRTSLLHREKEKWEVVSEHHLSWPAGASPSSGLMNLADVGPAIRDFISKNEWKGASAVLSLPRQEAFLKSVNLPSLDTQGVNNKFLSSQAAGRDDALLYTNSQEMRRAAERAFPFPLREMEWGLVLQRAPARAKERRALIAGAPRARLEAYRKILAEAGVTVIGIGLNFAAQATAIQGRDPAASNRSFHILDIGFLETQITFVQEGYPLFCHPVPLGAQHLTSENGEGTWAAQIQESRRLFRHNGHAAEPERVVLIGPIWEDQERRDELMKRLGLAGSAQVEMGSLFLAAQGQVMSVGSPNVLWLSRPLTPRSTISRVFSLHQNAVLAGSAIILLAASVGLRSLNDRAQSHLHQLNRELKIFKSEGRFTGAKTRVDDRALELLLALGKRLPLQTYLVDFSYDGLKRVIQVRGRSTDYSKISQFISELSNSGTFRGVRGERSNLTQIGNRQVVEFLVESSF